MNRPTITGALFVVCGLGILIAQDIIMKSLSTHYSVIQLMFVRGVFALLVMGCLLPFLSGVKVLQSNLKGMQILRGSLQFLSFGCYYFALKSMPILELVTIFFSAPLIAVALSVPILKEKVSAKHWAAVCLGFAGALLMIGPKGFGFDDSNAMFALGAAILYAGSIVVTRILGEADQGVTTALYTLIMYAVLAGMSVSVMEFIIPFVITGSFSAEPIYWITPTIQHTELLLVAGVAVCVSFLLIAHAYRQAPVSILVPWEYSALIWGGIFGYLFWNELPSILTILGATLIVSSGIYISRQSKVIV